MVSSAPARRILGIDPGLRVTGFGLIVASNGKLGYIASGCVRNTHGELPERIQIIVRDLASVIAMHRPTEVAVEKVFVNSNARSTLLLGARIRIHEHFFKDRKSTRLNSSHVS